MSFKEFSFPLDKHNHCLGQLICTPCGATENVSSGVCGYPPQEGGTTRTCMFCVPDAAERCLLVTVNGSLVSQNPTEMLSGGMDEAKSGGIHCPQGMPCGPPTPQKKGLKTRGAS